MKKPAKYFLFVLASVVALSSVFSVLIPSPEAAAVTKKDASATEKAKALQPDVEQVIQKMNHHFLNKLEADEAEKLIATLQKLIQ